MTSQPIDEYDIRTRLMRVKPLIIGRPGTIGGYAKEQVDDALRALDGTSHPDVLQVRRARIEARDLVRNAEQVLAARGRNRQAATELGKIADNLEYEELELADELGEDDLL